VARTAAIALLTVALALGLAAAPAKAGWSRPQRLAGPYSLDVLPAQLAFSPAGQTAVGFGVQNEDHPATSQALETLRSRSGRPGKPRRIPAAQQILDLAYDGSNLSLLIGTSPPGEPCCSSARLVTVIKGTPRRHGIVVSKLTGASLGRLLSLSKRRLLSAIATSEGVWVEQTSAAGHRGPAHLLTPAPAAPQTLAATTLRGNHTLVGWTAAAAQPAPAPPASIVVAGGSVRAVPRRPRVAVTVAAGHQIDELALGRGRAGATAAWIESFYDAGGVAHSQAEVADLTLPVRVRSFPIDGRLASGLSLATNAAGAQVLAWKVCDLIGSCRVEAATRDAGKRFGRPVALGRPDASQAPAAAVSGDGLGLVGWIDRGHVVAAARGRGARRFAAPRVVSATSFAADLTLAFGPRNRGLAVWTQGTFAQSVIGAEFMGP
jgi:hypothetical protein